MELQEGDLVLCTVEKIAGTIVHVKIDGDGEGSLHFSEISSGRIRNIRDYVVPKKRIVCKVLRIRNNHISLTFRRVSKKEREEVLEKERFEKSAENILKGVLKDKGSEIIEEIKEKTTISDFLDEAKENPKELEKLAGKENAQKIIKTLLEKQRKEIKITKEISLKSNAPNGIELIKKTLELESKIAEISYLAASRFKITIISENAKDASREMKKIIEEIESNAKKNKVEFHEQKKK